MIWKKKVVWKKIRAENFRKNFPAGVEVPESLIILLEYQELRAELVRERNYSGHFWLHDKFYELPPWVPLEIASYFIHFGFDADGSVYSFWLYKDFHIEKAPIVFTGCTWAGNTILANSLKEFLELLSLGVDELGYAVHYPQKWLSGISHSPDTIHFRNWLETTIGISMPSDPLKIVSDAKDSHPDFGKWIEERTGISPEKLRKLRWEEDSNKKAAPRRGRRNWWNKLWTKKK